ncbi:MAG: peroxiredoxin-like family protein [Phycisphaerales bacterium]
MNARLAAAALVAVSGLAIAEPGMTPKSSTGEPEPAQFTEDGKLAPRTGLPVGYDAPDALLRDDAGEEVQLAKLIEEADGPVVLVFYRGGWCPYCTKHLAELQHALPELEELDATLLAISPESYDKLEVSEEKAESEFTLLSDATNEAAKAYNLIFDVDSSTQSRYRNYGIDLDTWNATGEWKLPVPAVFVIDADGVIRWRHVDEDYRKRLAPKKLVEAVEKIAKG